MCAHFHFRRRSTKKANFYLPPTVKNEDSILFNQVYNTFNRKTEITKQSKKTKRKTSNGKYEYRLKSLHFLNSTFAVPSTITQN